MSRGTSLAAAFALLAASPAIARQPAAAEPTVSYALQPGDTLYDLAARYFTRADDYRVVKRLNHIVSPRRLPVGYVLRTPLRLLRTEPIEARVVDVTGQATLLVDGRATRITNGASVREGAEIETGADAFVRFELPDGSFVTLPSQSRFQVQTLRRTPLTGVVDRSFVLRAGRSEAVVTHMTRPGDSFIIRTPLSIAAVRGTTFRVGFDPQAEVATAEVVEGVVGVTSTVNGSAALVTKAFGDHATREGVGAPHALLEAPELDSPARVQGDASVSLKIVPIPGAVRYRAWLARDEGALVPFAETEADQPQLSFDKVADGPWFVRLTALDADGFEGLPTVYGFERLLHTLDLGSPVSTVRDAKAGWLFKWIIDPCDGAKAEYLIASARSRVAALDGEIRDYVARMLDKIAAYATVDDDSLFAARAAVGATALNIADIAGAIGMATIGEIARGLDAMIQSAADKRFWHADAVRLHIQSLGMVDQTRPDKSGEATILENLRALRRAVGIDE